MKTGEFVHIGSVITNALQTLRRPADMELVRVWELWEAAVGQAIAANTRPAAFRGKLLVVEVTSSTWLQELQFLKSDLITQVNAALGKPLIGDIRFKIGSV